MATSQGMATQCFVMEDAVPKETPASADNMCLARASCHVFQSLHGSSSKYTRVVAADATARCFSKHGRKGKKQRHRENKKRRKLLALETAPTDHREDHVQAVTLLGRKVYIAGINTRLLPLNLPGDCIRWSVGSHLIPYLNSDGKGCISASLYTLLPREWIRQCFPNTSKFFRLFMNILGLHPGLMPRGQSKKPVYDSGSPDTYVILGASAKRYGKGLRLVDRKLKEEEHANERYLLQKFFRQVAHASTAYLDTPSIRYLNVAKEMAGFSRFSFDERDKSLIWPSLAVAVNVVMEMHTDEDFVMGCAGVLGGCGYRQHDPMGSDILQYFCFPSYGSAVGLRNGDLLLFNPRVPHCVSSRSTMQEDVICTSFYLKTAIVDGNDNHRQDIPLSSRAATTTYNEANGTST